MSVSPLRTEHSLTKAFVDACAATGLRRIDDYCAGDVDGVFANFVTQRNGQRCSTADGYLDPIKSRKNLTVLTDAMVDRVIFDGDRAVGVEVIVAGAARTFKGRETILSAGAVMSPALLMRSGIGPGAHLQDMGVAVRRDAPSVGRNLQEHASFSSMRLVDVPTYNSMMDPISMARHLTEYVLFKRGMMTAAPVHALAFLRSDPALERPDIKLSFGPMGGMGQRGKPQPAITVYANVAAPKSRGEIRLRSANAMDKPVIDHRLLGHPDDVTALIRGMHQLDRIFEAPPLAAHLLGRVMPATPPKDDAEWEDLIRTRRHRLSPGRHLPHGCR